ncbi:pentapeptide repeat-containing protein [Niabella ginsengisoli]|uniref:Pentapeptide repeat-containing protein n=1 Tax=Niabella ginsengisoli TaxID=522298 RepID=A0ABS9SNX4_9BACT|nr:pentapeptide repeat-containing protein [Niabella ginsengisoli]MCH5600113.1 pentapeptide repeat-containing protein [Niabella ginsengisoli]
MLGLRFDKCSEFLFSASFTHCTLNFSSFYKLKIKKTKFQECIIQEVDFSETDLSEAVFDRCDLKDANFDNTILEKADFTTSYHYRIDPDNNKIRKAKFSRDGLAGLLTKYDIQIK